jgi:pSer/pThr/pTyr-binding forkhead associated (FHA) protein
VDGVHVFHVPRFPALIGRSEEADVRLSDRWTSRQHCRLEERDGVLVVRDLGSRHGTWVNQNRVVESPILPGDQLSVGLVTLRAKYEPADRP